MPAAHAFTRRHAVLLVVLTLVWGLNWPVMKLGVTGFAPLTFRALSMWGGLPLLAAALWWLKVPFRVPRAHWRELALLAVTNMIVWHVLAIVAVQSLSSGRAAILGYTMPIFSALWGTALFGQRLQPRNWLGVAAAALGVALLLWHEFGRLSGKPWAALAMLFAACVWALGTQQLRRTRMPLPLLTIAFWMTALTAAVMTLASVLFERTQWAAPTPVVWAAIAYNAVGVFGFAQPAWFYLARTLPPVASTLSVMMIPVLGVFAGALVLGEVLHWQDFTAVALMVLAILTVLLPSRQTLATARSA
ncbi:MAG: EamA family transporter [Betaproteobacteria bacterium]|nr:EamA family transporter [Betaproteobacteria bacterium]